MHVSHQLEGRGIRKWEAGEMAGVGKIWSLGQIQPTRCFHLVPKNSLYPV